ncbi:type I phosphodiesterase / nucleotide pyrophosphatase, partial [Opisthorchis viverrini]
ITSSVGATPISDTDGRTKLLLISFDGFRHDYLDKASSSGVNISGFLKIWGSGFRVSCVKNEFVTSTSSNHFSMVTGQHPESHGIVDNSFFDPMLNRTFAFSNGTQAKESVWFDVGAEPIWVTNQLHGHRTAMTSWTGAFAPIKNILPSISYPAFDPTIPLRKSIDDVIGWLETDVNLALLYHIEPDLTGHRYGPDSTEVLKAIGTLNHEVEYLLERVQKSPKLAHSLNIIIASDHGMAEVDPKRVIVLDDYLNSTMYNSSRESPAVVWGLWPKSIEPVRSDGLSLLEALTHMTIDRMPENDMLPKMSHTNQSTEYHCDSSVKRKLASTLYPGKRGHTAEPQKRERNECSKAASVLEISTDKASKDNSWAAART